MGWGFQQKICQNFVALALDALNGHGHGSPKYGQNDNFENRIKLDGPKKKNSDLGDYNGNNLKFQDGPKKKKTQIQETTMKIT